MGIIVRENGNVVAKHDGNNFEILDNSKQYLFNLLVSDEDSFYNFLKNRISTRPELQALYKMKLGDDRQDIGAIRNIKPNNSFEWDKLFRIAEERSHDNHITLEYTEI